MASGEDNADEGEAAEDSDNDDGCAAPASCKCLRKPIDSIQNNCHILKRCEMRTSTSGATPAGRVKGRRVKGRSCDGQPRAAPRPAMMRLWGEKRARGGEKEGLWRRRGGGGKGGVKWRLNARGGRQVEGRCQ